MAVPRPLLWQTKSEQKGEPSRGKNVILNGSPRRNGNTSALAHAFTQGAESAGHTVTEFFLDSMEIHGCKGASADTVAGIALVSSRTI